MINKKTKIRLIVISIVCAVSIAIVTACAIYLCDYYRASSDAQTFASEDAESYTLERSGDNIIFKPEKAEVGLIFYPGGKVEYTAYAPLMSAFAERGILCVLVKMPFNLAVLDMNAANGVHEDFPDIQHWYIGGHSLGGAMAASYAGKHPEEFDGLLLLGAYSTADLSQSDLCVMSLYGSEDGVMNAEKYESNRKNLPNGYNELVIEGGCHSYFGDYGMQKGDGSPSISRQDQIEATVTFFVENMSQ